jgi:DNA-directed RNA polymerase subunit RPC12/RpoP
MTQFICAVCGGIMSFSILTSMPPQDRYECEKCHRVVVEKVHYDVQLQVIK